MSEEKNPVEELTQSDSPSKTDSIIETSLDMFLINPILSFIPPKYITRQFITGIILLVFLLYIYISYGIFKLDLSPLMIVWYILLAVLVIEILIKNYKRVCDYFSNDQKSLNFLKDIDSMTDEEMMVILRTHIFSSKCMNRVLTEFKNDLNKFPPYIINYIVTSQDLTKENLDIFFSKETLKNLEKVNENIVVEILCQKIDRLTETNIRQTYDVFQNNERLIKILFATQIQSKILFEYSNPKFQEYFDIFQVKKTHLDCWLKIFPPKWFFLSNKRRIIGKWTMGLLVIFLILLIFNIIPINSTTTIFIMPIFFGIFLFFPLISLIILPKISKRYFSHLKKHIEETF